MSIGRPSLLLSLSGIVLLYASSAHAQDMQGVIDQAKSNKSLGIHQMEVTPPAASGKTEKTSAAKQPAAAPATKTKAEPETKPEETKAASDESPKYTAPVAKQKTPPKPVDPFSVKELKKFDSLPDLLRDDPKDVRAKDALESLSADPGNAPPLALFMAARLLARSGKMEDAAKYYYAAQLRARFDNQRWPFPVKNAANSPHLALYALSQQVGQEISPWAMTSSARMQSVLDAAKDWDAVTPYAYLPDYDLPKTAIPQEKWPDMLKSARESYFSDAQRIVSALKAMGR